MSTAPKKSGTETVTTDNTPWNSSYLTDLYDSAQGLYGKGSTLYTDPTSTVSYANYLQAADNQTLNTVPAATNAWQDLVGGSAGVQNSPVYNDLYNLGTGNTTQQRNLDSYSSRLSDIADNSQSAANSYANSLTDIGGRAADAGQRYADLSTDYGSRAADSGRAYGGYLTDAASGAIDSGRSYGNTLSSYGQDAIGAGNSYGNTLSGYSTGAIDTGQRYGGYLSDIGRDVLNQCLPAAAARHRAGPLPERQSVPQQHVRYCGRRSGPPIPDRDGAAG